MPEEVRAEIAPWFIGKQAIADDVPEKIVKLDNKAMYVNSDLKVKISCPNHSSIASTSICTVKRT